MEHTHTVEVLLDGVALPDGGGSLTTALKAAAEAARKRGRIVVEVKADGLPLAGDDAAAEPAKPQPRVVECQSADPRELVAQTLVDAADALTQARGDQQEVAELIQSGRTSEGVDRLRVVLATWTAVRDVVGRGGALLGVNLLDQPVGDPAAQEKAQGLRESLRALRDGMEAEDWSAIADVVAYDLDAQATAWDGLLRAMAGWVRKG